MDIRQAGTPFDLYNYPATSFMAHFVSAVNQLRCEVLDTRRGQLHRGNQPMTLPGPLSLQTSAIATIMIRPFAPESVWLVNGNG